MSSRPKFHLSTLREIDWSKWDPIGLAGSVSDWPADEYDGYLLQAAGQIWNGSSDEAVADYLVKIETEHMGWADAPGVRSRAVDVARSLREYVETLRS